MSEYKNIIGKGIRFVSSNLDNDQAEGQIWYNSTDGALKNVILNEAWVSASPMITARRLMASSSSGPQTAALGVGGYIDGTGDTAVTEEYNGSGFSTGTSINTARREFDGAGTQTATLVFGGRIGSNQQRAETEEFNGSSWSEQNDLNTGRQRVGGAGVQTAALAFAGITDGDATEEYNGTSWTAANNMGSGTYGQGASGTQTAALSCGGNPYRTTTEEYDGTNWTTVNSLNTGRMFMRASGTQTTTLAFGGKTPPNTFSTASESYDGTTWTNTPSLANAVAESGRGGGNSAAISFGGFAPPSTSRAEEFTRSANVITAAAWASGGSMNTGRYLLAGCGASESALLGAGGYGPPAPSNNTFKIVEEYNGSSWSEVNDLPAIKSRFRAAGTQTAAVTFGGFTPLGPNTNYNTSEEYDGTNWTSGGTMNTARCYMAGFGTQTAAVSAGGANLNPDVGYNKTEEYDGTSWSEVNNMPNFFRNQAGVGILTAGVTTGGKEGPSSSYPGIVNTTTTVEYDGTNWTAGGTSLVPNGNPSGGGTQSVAWFAGYPGDNGNFHYNGTSFVTSASTSTTHSAAASGAPQTSGVIFAGFTGTAITAATEEFTGESSALNIKTITTS